eukprot:12841856-Ditylum_brightwellii.AAC.1
MDTAQSEKDDAEFEKILDHRFQKGALILKVQYYITVLAEDNIEEVPFTIIKKDEPLALARYIKEYVVEKSRRNGFYNTWATKKRHEEFYTTRRSEEKDIKKCKKSEKEDQRKDWD